MRTLTRSLPSLARVALGVVFVVFGLDGFLQVLPMPPPEGAAAGFLGGISTGGWFLPLLKGTEVAAGLLLLSNRFVPLSLAVLAPIVVNIAAFHAFLAPEGAAIAIALIALELYLAWAYRGAFAPMLRARVEPARAGDAQAPRAEIRAAAVS